MDQSLVDLGAAPEIAVPTDAFATIASRFETCPTPDAMLAFARVSRSSGTLRNRHFPQSLFRETAWEMMLDLFIAHEERRRLCVKDLILATSETPTSALRKIDTLEALDLLERRTDPIDHRRVLVVLSERGLTAMVEFFRDALAHREGPSQRKPVY